MFTNFSRAFKKDNAALKIQDLPSETPVQTSRRIETGLGSMALRAKNLWSKNMNATLLDQRTRERWSPAIEPGHEATENATGSFLQAAGCSPRILNYSVPLAATELTNFHYPKVWDFDRCLKTSGNGYFSDGLADWKYRPKTQAVRQLPQMESNSSEWLLRKQTYGAQVARSQLLVLLLTDGMTHARGEQAISFIWLSGKVSVIVH
jgi:hypothetical protein